MTLPLKPRQGGFVRSIQCSYFIRDFLLGKGPYGSLIIDPNIGACQADIFREYKLTLIRTTALDRATRTEEKRARKENRSIDPDNIDKLYQRYLAHMPYKAQGCTFHSFVVYFSNIQRLDWIEATGREEPSQFQDHYLPGPPRKYFHLTKKGRDASDNDWRNPLKTLYGLQIR